MGEKPYPWEVDSPETEVVYRWLECEEGIQDQVSDLARRVWEDVRREVGATSSQQQRDVAAQRLAQGLREFVQQRSPLRGEVSLYSQLLASALNRVHWDVLAAWLLPEDEAADE
jgi:hypothetical protein